MTNCLFLGGPLACDGKLVGIISNGRGCALPKYPGIYIDVNYYRDWIANVDVTINKSSKFTLNFMTQFFCIIFMMF